jgi:hypothetical protein
MSREPADPFQPISAVVRLLLWFCGLIFVVAALLTVFGHANLFSWRSDSVCVIAVNPPTALSTAGLKPDVSGGVTGIDICTKTPSVGQRLLSTLDQAPDPLLFIGVLLSIWLLIRDAERHGLYTTSMATRLRGIGWLLLLGGLAVMIIQGEAASCLATSMLEPTPETGAPWLDLDYWQVPTVTLLTALGVLSFARIMRIGSVLREDLEGTV